MNNSMPPLFDKNELLRIRGLFGGWRIGANHFFGPFELLSFTPSDAYKEFLLHTRSGASKGAAAVIVLITGAGSVALSAFVALLILRRHIHKRQSSKKLRFVAIKRAQEGSLQGEKEFLTEIELLSRLHHRNLVSLIGYCDEEGEQMLVYEFIPNGTLRDHLSGKFKAPLSFAMRVRTALGAARGILYLHTEADPPIFHRDIKTSNILLDTKYTAKVADFGLSKLAPGPEIEGGAPCHVSTAVKGTPGYLDPEYFLTHKLTDKSDVYSLGVVFMELLTGLPPISRGKNIVREVNTAYRCGIVFSMMDQLMGSYPSECVEKFVNLALKCCKDETDERPSMAEVVRELENIWVMMPADTDTEIITESLVTDPSPSSSSFLTTSYVSDDVMDSDLISGVAPSVAPR